MSTPKKSLVTLEEFYYLLDKYKRYAAKEISLLDFLELSPSSSDEEIKRRCKRIKRVFHPDNWGGHPKELELATKYSNKINSDLDSLKPNRPLDSHFTEENYAYSEYEYILFDVDKKHKVDQLRKLLNKDSAFLYDGLDSLIEYYITSTIDYISPMSIKQESELINAYFNVLQLIATEYKKFYNRFVSSNFILVKKIEPKDKPAFNESLEEYASKLKNIKRKYSLSAILRKKLEMKLSNKKRYSNDMGPIEMILKVHITEIANRGLNADELSIDTSDVIEKRCAEFDVICSSYLETYRKIKRTVPTLKNRYFSLRPLCKDKSILSEIESLLKDLESSLKTINSFDLVFNKISEVILMLESIKFKGRVANKIDRYYNDVMKREMRKCKDDDKKAYWGIVSSNLENIYNSWMGKLNISAGLLVELFKEIDINNREKTDRILMFLNYSTSSIFVRRKESSPSKDDFDSFYILEHAGLNSSNFLIYQINPNGKVSSCPIEIGELFEFYLPIDEVIFLRLKYYFRAIDFDGNILCDDINNGYFLLSGKENYGISVGDNVYSYNSKELLSIDGVDKASLFVSVCDFVKKRLNTYKKTFGYSKK